MLICVHKYTFYMSLLLVVLSEHTWIPFLFLNCFCDSGLQSVMQILVASRGSLPLLTLSNFSAKSLYPQVLPQCARRTQTWFGLNSAPSVINRRVFRLCHPCYTNTNLLLCARKSQPSPSFLLPPDCTH